MGVSCVGASADIGSWTKTRHVNEACKSTHFTRKNGLHERKHWRVSATLRYKTPTCSPLSSQTFLEGHSIWDHDGWEVRRMPAKKKPAAKKPAAKKVAAKKPAAKKAAAKKK